MRESLDQAIHIDQKRGALHCADDSPPFHAERPCPDVATARAVAHRPAWEVDNILLEDLPEDLERQVLLIAAERGSGVVTGAQIGPVDGAPDALIALLHHAMEEPLAGPARQPDRILVRRPELELMLRVELHGRGIAVERVGRLLAVDEAAPGFARHLAGAGPPTRLYEGIDAALPTRPGRLIVTRPVRPQACRPRAGCTARGTARASAPSS